MFRVQHTDDGLLLELLSHISELVKNEEVDQNLQPAFPADVAERYEMEQKAIKKQRIEMWIGLVIGLVFGLLVFFGISYLLGRFTNLISPLITLISGGAAAAAFAGAFDGFREG